MFPPKHPRTNQPRTAEGARNLTEVWALTGRKRAGSTVEEAPAEGGAPAGAGAGGEEREEHKLMTERSEVGHTLTLTLTLLN